MIDAPIVWEQDQAADATIPSVLQAWAAARGLRLVAPSAGGRHVVAVDPKIATRVEEALHAARELVTQHDAEGAERALARAEALLRAHPELPQAPWLLAEVERGWAMRFSRLDPVDTARAARAWRAATALDGGRLAGVGETAAAPEPAVPFSLQVAGGGTTLRLDGNAIEPGASRASPGLHQLVARTEAGDVVFAEWIAIAPGALVRVVLPTPEPCSSGDLSSRAPACATWVRARESGGTFFVRTCNDSGCGPELAVAPLIAEPPRHPVVVRHGLPVWATWTLVGASVVVAGVAAGAIGWAALPTTTRTVFTTSKPQ